MLQKGTLVLKEMLKIDGAGAESSSPQVAANSSGRQQNRRQPGKKLGIYPTTSAQADPTLLKHGPC